MVGMVSPILSIGYRSAEDAFRRVYSPPDCFLDGTDLRARPFNLPRLYPWCLDAGTCREYASNPGRFLIQTHIFFQTWVKYGPETRKGMAMFIRLQCL